jgi:thiamine-phosphate pyrophosphorylase
MDRARARILDANSNRAREALRMLEDFARFALDDQPLAASIKHLRHTLAGLLQNLGIADAIWARDTVGDVGTDSKTTSEFNRATLADVVIAAGKRLSEALRVIEEIAKTENPTLARQIEQLRYAGYTIEQSTARAALPATRFGAVRLVLLLTDSLCHHGWEKTLTDILSVADETTAPQLCIQVREKDLSDRQLLHRAAACVTACRAKHVCCIINDRPDIALATDADGVHLGQDDLPIAAARAILGRDKIIGVSTGHLAEAQQAVRDGANYLGAGPMFPTTTKHKPTLAGPAYAAELIQHIPIPCVAIGGITRDNLPMLRDVGVSCVAVCAAVISDPDPAARVRELLALLPA